MATYDLNGDERVLFESRKHWFAPIRASGAAVLMLIGAWLVGWIAPDAGSGFLGGIGKIANLIQLGLFVGGAIWIAANIVSWRTATFAVTSERLIHEEGLIARRSSTTSLPSITDVRTHIGPMGRTLGFGDLDVISQSGEYGADHLLVITHPVEFREAAMAQKLALAKMIRAAAAPVPQAAPAAAAPAAAAPAAAPVTSTAEALNTLADLHERGIVSDEEYEAKKAELLARL